MAAFLLCALAIPRAFGEGGVAFGVGYLTVVVVHAGLYAQVYGRRVAMLAALNVLAALSVIAAGRVGGVAAYLLWVAAIVVQFVAPTMVDQGFPVRPRHFVERHGLLLLIALGESVVAVGIGIGDVAPDVRVFLTAVLGLGLAAALWWVYFVSDEAAAEEAMVRASPRERFTLAIRAYFFAFIPMLLGIIVAAAGVKHAVGHTAERLDQGPALALSLGVAAYLWGNVLFRQSLGTVLDRSWPRVAAGATALGTVVLGVAGTALAELVGLVAVLVVLLTYEATRQTPGAQRSP
jgi:low temperature requirement protein LtrA